MMGTLKACGAVHSQCCLHGGNGATVKSVWTWIGRRSVQSRVDLALRLALTCCCLWLRLGLLLGVCNEVAAFSTSVATTSSRKKGRTMLPNRLLTNNLWGSIRNGWYRCDLKVCVFVLMMMMVMMIMVIVMMIMMAIVMMLMVMMVM